MTTASTIPKILFIGNSLTYYNNGLWTHLKVSFWAALQNISSIVQNYSNSAAFVNFACRGYAMQRSLRSK
jgi:hypothetical protein